MKSNKRNRLLMASLAAVSLVAFTQTQNASAAEVKDNNVTVDGSLSAAGISAGGQKVTNVTDGKEPMLTTGKGKDEQAQALHRQTTDTSVLNALVSVKKNPGGTKLKTTTDKSGKFSFAKLEPGTYTVTINPAKGDATAAKAAVVTSRSNIKHPKTSVVNGAEVYNLAVTLGANAASCEIVVGMGGATINGTVTAAEPAKEPAKTGNKVPVK